jgi:diaminopimelate decarboxylase
VGKPVSVALRLNPDVEVNTHAYISTGKDGNKFGVAIDHAAEVVEDIVKDPWLQLVGYHVHLGSQLQSVEPYVQAFERVAAFVDGDQKRRDGEPLDVATVAAELLPRLRERSWTPVIEPGRYLVGDAGILVTSVLGEKLQGRVNFLLVDAAMNDLIRPALYQAEHAIVPVVWPDGAETLTVDVVGPVCESSDFLGRDRDLPRCQRGDLLAILAVGAYGASMASNYNSRRRPAEVIVDGEHVRLVRRRETFAQLFQNEIDT